jgi:hypothetical protein
LRKTVLLSEHFRFLIVEQNWQTAALFNGDTALETVFIVAPVALAEKIPELVETCSVYKGIHEGAQRNSAGSVLSGHGFDPHARERHRSPHANCNGMPPNCGVNYLSDGAGFSGAGGGSVIPSSSA